MKRPSILFVLLAIVLFAVPVASLIHCEAKPPAPPAQPAPPPTPPGPEAAVPPSGPATRPEEPGAQSRGELLRQAERQTGQAYLLYLPDDYRADRQFPLLLLGQDARGQAAGAKPQIDPHWLAAADRDDWLVLAFALNARDAGSRPTGELDLKSAKAVLAEVLGRWSVDRSRMHLVGGEPAGPPSEPAGPPARTSGAPGSEGPARMAVQLAADRPQRFAGLVLLNPVIADGQGPAGPAPKDLPPALVVFIEKAWQDPATGRVQVPQTAKLAASRWLTRLGFTNVGVTEVPDWPDAIQPTVDFLKTKKRQD